jgi:hypothetical protein
MIVLITNCLFSILQLKNVHDCYNFIFIYLNTHVFIFFSDRLGSQKLLNAVFMRFTRIINYRVSIPAFLITLIYR